MFLTVSVEKPENAANVCRPLTQLAAVRANYARLAAKRRERDNGRLAARMALCELPCDEQGRVAFAPRRYRIIWPFKGSRPDADNIVARMNHVLDGCAMAFGIDDRDLELEGVERCRITHSNPNNYAKTHVYIRFSD